MATDFSVTETLDLPPETAFRALTDPEGVRAWMPGLERIEREGDGSRVRLDAEIRGLTGFAALLSRLTVAAFRKARAKNLAALKAHLEA